MGVTREALVALHAKYSEMLALRLASAEGGGEDPIGRRATLAARFPGALREIDELPLSDIRARIAAVEAASCGGATPPWMEAIWRFHELTRALLAAKRWVHRAAEDGAELPHDATAWKDDLARVADPPGGRLSLLVLDRIAAELAVTRSEARALVFPWSRRRGGLR